MNFGRAPQTLFLKYKNYTVKITEKDFSTNFGLSNCLLSKFPWLSFPGTAFFYNEATGLKLSQNDSCKDLPNGSVIRVSVPMQMKQAPELRSVVFVSNFPVDCSTQKLRSLLRLDERVRTDDFIPFNQFAGNKYERAVFIELPGQADLAAVLKFDQSPTGQDDEKLSVKRLDENLSKNYLLEKRKLKVLKIDNVSPRVTTADLRIFFYLIPIFSIHLMEKGIAFIEVDEEHFQAALNHNKDTLDDRVLIIKKSSPEKLLRAVRAARKLRAQAKLKLNSPANRDLQSKRPKVEPENVPSANFKRQVAPGTEQQNFNPPPPKRFSDKDFKCALGKGFPEGSSQLDIARFFFGGNVQPVLMHLNKNGTQVYCEFATPNDCDAAVSMNKKRFGNSEILISRVPYSEVEKVVSDTKSEFKVDSRSESNNAISSQKRSEPSFPRSEHKIDKRGYNTQSQSIIKEQDKFSVSRTETDLDAFSSAGRIQPQYGTGSSTDQAINQSELVYNQNLYYTHPERYYQSNQSGSSQGNNGYNHYT